MAVIDLTPQPPVDYGSWPTVGAAGSGAGTPQPVRGDGAMTLSGLLAMLARGMGGGEGPVSVAPVDAIGAPMALPGAVPQTPVGTGMLFGGQPARPATPTPDTYPSWPTVGAGGSAPPIPTVMPPERPAGLGGAPRASLSLARAPMAPMPPPRPTGIPAGMTAEVPPQGQPQGVYQSDVGGTARSGGRAPLLTAGQMPFLNKLFGG